MDSEDTLNFSALTGVKPLIETYPLDGAAEAFDRMMSGKTRFRVVLTTGAYPIFSGSYRAGLPVSASRPFSAPSVCMAASTASESFLVITWK
jgi:hypothetical protein